MKGLVLDWQFAAFPESEGSPVENAALPEEEGSVTPAGPSEIEESPDVDEHTVPVEPEYEDWTIEIVCDAGFSETNVIALIASHGGVIDYMWRQSIGYDTHIYAFVAFPRGTDMNLKLAELRSETAVERAQWTDDPEWRVEGELLVSLREGITEEEADAVFERHGFDPSNYRKFLESPMSFVVTFSEETRDFEDLVQEFLEDPDVRYAEPNGIIVAL